MSGLENALAGLLFHHPRHSHHPESGGRCQNEKCRHLVRAWELRVQGQFPYFSVPATATVPFKRGTPPKQEMPPARQSVGATGMGTVSTVETEEHMGRVEHYYAQMKLMETENGQLRQQAFAKQQGRAKCTKDREIDTTHGWHMTSEEMMDTLAYIECKQAWKDLLKEAAPKFKLQWKLIDDYYKQVAADEREKEQRQKEDERIVKKAADETEKVQKQEEREQ
ncbi:hypothetical protein BS17DRAFT_768088 [Gyrodon lividus]|nr:hypothetical protein BS17DRAFT_768088 [Gyrodon lividus]